MTGRIVFSGRRVYRVVGPEGEWEARLAGRLLHAAASGADLPVTGDFVEYRVSEGLALIDQVHARTTRISRRAAGKREEEQVLAANVDLIFIVCGLDGDFNVRRIERYMVLATESGARTCVVLNKADLCLDALGDRVSAARAAAPGVAVITASTCIVGGIEPLQQMVQPGTTIVLLGSSGAGKSSIINRLLGTELLSTGEVRQDDSRGRHTTTSRELFPLPNDAWVIDTPGLREIQLWAGGESLEEAFEDVASLVQTCRFSDCSHGGEPGCAVVEALADGRLDAGRWGSYVKLLDEVRRHSVQVTDHERAVQKRELKKLHKQMRHGHR